MATPARQEQRSAQQIRQDIVRTRNELATSVGDLRLAVERKTDFRRILGEHRREAVMGAVAVGFLIGGGLAVFGRRRGG